MAETLNVLLTEQQVNDRISEIAAEINRDYAGKSIHLICVLKGGAMFMCELAKRLTLPVSFDFMCVSSYGSGTTSSGIIRILKDLDDEIENKHVLIVEDIIDTGRTLKALVELLQTRKPASVKICALLDKHESRTEQEIQGDYICFEIPSRFVVGYGLDYDQKYRNLPYIATVSFS